MKLQEKSPIKNYNFGKEQYTEKNMVPVDILSLAMAYSQQSANKLIGNNLDSMIRVSNDLAKLTGGTQSKAGLQSGNKAMILFLLKNQLVTATEYKELYKKLVELHKIVINRLKNAEQLGRTPAKAKNKAKADMKDEAVNEADNADDVRRATKFFGDSLTGKRLVKKFNGRFNKDTFRSVVNASLNSIKNKNSNKRMEGFLKAWSNLFGLDYKKYYGKHFIESDTFLDDITKAGERYYKIYTANNVISIESVNESREPGDKLIHKHNKDISIELISTTNRGWKVKQTEPKGPRSKKTTTQYYDSQDISGDKSLFESVNEASPEIKMNNLDWGKSTAERNTNLDKHKSLKTDKEKNEFLRKLKGESVNEAKSMDKSQKLKIYNGLKKGDVVDIKYDSSMKPGSEYKSFVVSKGKAVVGKRKVERITLQLKDKPGTVKFYLYNTNKNIGLAIGDMAAVIVDMKMGTNESINEDKKGFKIEIDLHIDNSSRTPSKTVSYIMRNHDSFNQNVREFDKYLKFIIGYAKKHGYAYVEFHHGEHHIGSIDARYDYSFNKGSGYQSHMNLKENVNEAKKINPDSMKFLKGMEKTKVNGLNGHMPGVDYVYYDKKSKKYWFVDFEGNHMELRNQYDLDQFHKAQGKSTSKGISSADKAYFKKHKKELMNIIDDDIFISIPDAIKMHKEKNESINESKVDSIITRIKSAYDKSKDKNSDIKKLKDQLKTWKKLGKDDKRDQISAGEKFLKSINEAGSEEPQVIQDLRWIVQHVQNKKIKDPKTGSQVRMDLFSSSAIVQVYDAISKQNKEKYVTLSLPKMANTAFKVMKK